MKPTVHYRASMAPVVPGVGCSALLFPLDHQNHLPGQRVSNMKVARTSAVVAYDKITGRIETLNTIYMPEEALI